MISTISNLSATAQSSNIGSPMYFRGSGKLQIPVNPALVIYSQFEHVSGVPAENAQQGVNISKIKILDTLIGRLSNMKQQPTIPEESLELSDTQIDALIQDYQNRIQNIVTLAQSNPYALGSVAPETGVLFSIAA